MDLSTHEPPSPDDVAALRVGLAGSVLRPGDDGYDAARVVWNGMIDRRPAYIARCAGTADIIESVGFARRHGLEVSVRGGGHNVAGYAVCEGGLMIDLSAMRAVRVDPAARRAWVQGERCGPMSIGRRRPLAWPRLAGWFHKRAWPA